MDAPHESGVGRFPQRLEPCPRRKVDARPKAEAPALLATSRAAPDQSAVPSLPTPARATTVQLLRENGPVSTASLPNPHKPNLTSPTRSTQHFLRETTHTLTMAMYCNKAPTNMGNRPYWEPDPADDKQKDGEHWVPGGEGWQLKKNGEYVYIQPPRPFMDMYYSKEFLAKAMADYFYGGSKSLYEKNYTSLSEMAMEEFFNYYGNPNKDVKKEDREFDVVFYGVSGYTGMLVMEYLKRDVLAKGRFRNAKIGFAGRTLSKVVAMRDKICKGIPELENTPCFGCSLTNPHEVINLVLETRVVANIAGPFMITGGEAFVEACAEFQTDYVDCNGEIPYTFKLLDFHHLAREFGTRIVPCAAYAGGMPDVAVFECAKLVRERYNGAKCRQVRCYAETEGEGSGASGGTLATRAAMSTAPWAASIMRKTYALGGESFEHNGWGTREEDADKHLMKVFKDEYIGQWCAPHMYSFFETRIVRRANWLQGEYNDQSYGNKMCYREHILAPDEVTANMIKQASRSTKGEEEDLKKSGKYYKAGEGPSMEDIADIKSIMSVLAVTESGEQCPIIKFTGADAYYETARMTVEVSLALALDADKLMAAGGMAGGVLTPTAACGSILTERLLDSGMTMVVEGDSA